MRLSWTQLSAPPRTVLFRWKSFHDHVDHAAPRSPGRWMTARPRKRMTPESTVAAKKCLLITRKIIIPPPDSRDPPNGPPYLAKKTFPPDCWDPPDGPSYFAKKTFPLLSARTHRKCLLITYKKVNTPLLAGTHLCGRLTCGPTKLTGTEGFVNLVNINDSSSSDRTMSIQWP